jgi:hypothetical protein
VEWCPKWGWRGGLRSGGGACQYSNPATNPNYVVVPESWGIIIHRGVILTYNRQTSGFEWWEGVVPVQAKRF